jgi:hypothetical protein
MDESGEHTAHYSLLRFVPDPLRDEAINVGLVAVSDDGEWGRLRVQVPRTRLSAINRRDAAPEIENWATVLRNEFDLNGARGLLSPATLVSAETLEEWAESFGGLLRVSRPRVAVDHDLEQLWRDLFSRLVRGNGGDPRMRSASSRRRTAGEERAAVIDTFVAAVRRWPTFDPSRLMLGARFDGSKAIHFADLAIVNGRVTAVAQVIPIVHGSDREVVTSRALLVDAAFDLSPDVAKLGLYDDPPSERREMLEDTRSVIQEMGPDRNLTLVPARRFAALEAEYAMTFFPPVEDQ